MNTSISQSLRSGSGLVARRVARDTSSMLFLAQLVAAGAAFVANILASRAMGPSGRGELALLLQLAYFGSLGVLLGSDRSVVAIYQGQPAHVVTTAFLRLLLRPSAVGLALVAAIIVLPLPGLGSWRLRLVFAALFMVVNAFDRAIRAVAIAAGRAGDYLWYGITQLVLLLAGLWLLVVLHLSASALWMLVYLLVGVVSGWAWLWWWRRTGQLGAGPLPATATATAEASDQTGTPPRRAPGEVGQEQDRRRRARREGLQLLPATLSSSGTLRLDRLILAGLASTTALGLYASVSTITELITWPLIVFADARLGVWRQVHDRGTLSLRRVFVLALGYSVVAAGLLAAALHLLVVPLLGARYAAALPLVVPLTCAAAVFGLSRLLVMALTAVRHGTLSSAVEVIGLVASVVAYVVLIGRYGALGAAYGSLVGYSVCLLVGAVLFVRVRRSRPAADAPLSTLGSST